MRHLLAIFLIMYIFCTSMTAQVSFGTPETINKNWNFKLGEQENAQSIDYDNKGWRVLDLPHDWSVEGILSSTYASATGYLPGGIGWYRKSLNIPSERSSEKVFIYFEGVYNNSEVFVNGTSVGKRPNGYVSFMYDITDHVKFGKENIIAVRVDHSKYNDSRWYTGSGIYRDVYLVYSNFLHIGQWGVSYEAKNVTDKQADLEVGTKVKNETNNNANIVIEQFVTSMDGKIVSKNTKKMTVTSQQSVNILQTLKIASPKLWSIDNPNLYLLKTIISQNGKVIDQSSTTMGIRTTTFDPNKGFALNGEWMKLKGVCLHHDAGVLGSAVPKKVWKRRLENLKSLGCNAIRMSHNPQAPDLYDLCDELGFVVMDEAFDEWEFPKRKWIEGWNVGTPGFDGYAPNFNEWGERDLRDVVLRDKRHPSIIMWSIGNEVDYPNDPYSHPVLDGESISQKVFGGYQPERPNAMDLGGIAKRLAKVVKDNDPSRPVTAALAGVVMSNYTEYPAALDVAGYNYTEDRYHKDHMSYPKRIIYGSENRHDFDAWKAVRDNEFIFGQFLWTGIDYLGESGVWPSRGFYSGLLDFGGFKKPRAYFRESLWSNKPMVYIGTYLQANHLSMDAWPIWNYTDGEKIRVVCYTNCTKAKLLLNGKIVGEVKEYDDTTGILYWDIPYQEGTLEVVALDKNNAEQAKYSIRSSNRPYALTANAMDNSLQINGDVTHVVIEIVDENGIPVMLADNEITCEIEGPARLLGLEASNNADMSDYTDNKQRAFHGRLLAYIQSSGEIGDVTVKFSSPWVKETKVKLNIVK